MTMTNPNTWPLALTVREQGDANHYAIQNGNNWLGALRINGELTMAAQADLVRVLAAAPVLLDALGQLQANPNDPRAHRRALDAMRVAGSTESVRNYFEGKARMTKRIQLEDRGQDFLWWDVDKDGVVVDCGPLQGWLWEGTIVLNHADIGPGEILRIKTKDGRTTTLNYPCREVQAA